MPSICIFVAGFVVVVDFVSAVVDVTPVFDVVAYDAFDAVVNVEVGVVVNVEFDVAACVVTGGVADVAVPDDDVAADIAYDAAFGVDVVKVCDDVVRGNGSAGKACLSRPTLLYIHYPP